MKHLVIGLDPGFASLGFSVLELGATPADDLVVSVGVIRTAPSAKKQRILAADDNNRRGREVSMVLRGLAERGASSPEVTGQGLGALFPERRVSIICAERMSFPRNASAAAKMALSWGMIIAHAERLNLPILQASPQDVKRKVAGKADASKEDVEKAIVKRFGRGLYRMLKAVPATQHEHAFDSVAAAVTCLDSDEVRLLRAAVVQ